MNHLFDYLSGVISEETEKVLEELYKTSRIFESNDFQKGEDVVAPVETVKRIGTINYIKLEDGWNYLEKAEKEGKVKKPEKTREQLEKEQAKKNGVESPSIQEGHEITAPDGTSGKVTSHDGKMVTVEYVKNGEKVEAQVPASVLEERKAKGEIQHNANPKTLKELHQSLIEEMHLQDKDATAIIAMLKNLGVDETEALEAVTEFRKKHPQKEKTEKKKVEKSIYQGGLQERKGQHLLDTFEKGVVRFQGETEEDAFINHCGLDIEDEEKLKKAGHPTKFHEKYWKGGKWNYSYSEHLPKGSAEKLEASGYSQAEEQRQRKQADDITTTVEKINNHLKQHDEIQKEIVSQQQSIQAIVNHDGRDNKSTNPMKSKVHELGAQKEKQINIVKHLHNNLITRLTR